MMLFYSFRTHLGPVKRDVLLVPLLLSILLISIPGKRRRIKTTTTSTTYSKREDWQHN